MDVSISVSSPGFDLFLLSPKNTLWQASREDQLRNIGMPSFMTVTADDSSRNSRCNQSTRNDIRVAFHTFSVLPVDSCAGRNDFLPVEPNIRMADRSGIAHSTMPVSA